MINSSFLNEKKRKRYTHTGKTAWFFFLIRLLLCGGRDNCWPESEEGLRKPVVREPMISLLQEFDVS